RLDFATLASQPAPREVTHISISVPLRHHSGSDTDCADERTPPVCDNCDMPGDGRWCWSVLFCSAALLCPRSTALQRFLQIPTTPQPYSFCLVWSALTHSQSSS